ncbi:MAG: ribosome biogenesis GTP-binding protein YihA/YsxC [Cytophagales bacterium]|nr:ribosome biogenesis GTP-binding protein YihA/YsxC [Cytophagales bacterium]
MILVGVEGSRFLASYAKASQCPLSDLPEHALIGRSNVGKSSLINSLFNRKGLAKTSSRPGKTRLLCQFSIGDEWTLMDLPGYGWTELGKKERERIKRENIAYLLGRKNLACLWVLLDSCLPPQQQDLDFLRWVGNKEIPFIVILSKVDKLSAAKLSRQEQVFRKTLSEYWNPLPLLFLSSAKTHRGQEELMEMVARSNELFGGY